MTGPLAGDGTDVVALIVGAPVSMRTISLELGPPGVVATTS